MEKSRTTAYHPQGDGTVERFNRSLLQLLQSYVESQNDWEHYLPLVLYAYRTTTHSSTRAHPFMLMFGRSQVLPQLTQANTLMLHHTLVTSPPNLPNFRIWSNPIWPQPPKIRRQRTTSTSCANHSQPETRFGCQYPLQGSWILGGREDGKSSQARAQKMWKSRTAKYLKLSM